MSKNIAIICIIGVIACIVGGIVYTRTQPSPLDGFAQCLKDKGAVFYGAFWCPHCQNTKKLFGRAARHLPYTECSTPDGQGQTSICVDKKISTYPTWEFADGSRLDGERTLEELSGKTGCVLPS